MSNSRAKGLSLLLVGKSQLSTSHEVVREAQVHMLPRTDPLEMYSRNRQPVSVPTPGGLGGGPVLTRQKIG